MCDEHTWCLSSGVHQHTARVVRHSAGGGLRSTLWPAGNPALGADAALVTHAAFPLPQDQPQVQALQLRTGSQLQVQLDCHTHRCSRNRRCHFPNPLFVLFLFFIACHQNLDHCHQSPPLPPLIDFYQCNDNNDRHHCRRLAHSVFKIQAYCITSSEKLNMLQIVHYHNKGNSKPLFKIIRTKNVKNIGYKILVKGTLLRPGRKIKKKGGGRRE